MMTEEKWKEMADGVEESVMVVLYGEGGISSEKIDRLASQIKEFFIENYNEICK